MLGEAQSPSVATPAAAVASRDLRMLFSLGRRADGALFGCDVMSLSSYADRFNHPACLVGAHAPMRGSMREPRALPDPLWQMVGLRQGREFRDGAFELQFDRAGRAVALLADDDLGPAVHLFALRQPFREFLAVGLQRLAHLVIVLVAEYEQHHVGVLFDRA